MINDKEKLKPLTTHELLKYILIIAKREKIKL